MKNIISICVLFCLISIQTYGTSYTWVGTTNVWTLNTNWSPATVPGSSDNVTITSTGASPKLQGNVTITNLTISGKTLDLNGYTLIVNGTGTFGSGSTTTSTTVNALLKLRGTTMTFSSGATLDVNIDAVVSTLKFNGAIFNKKGYFEANSTTPGTSNGGSIFSDSITIYRSNTGSGQMQLGNDSGNRYDSYVKLINGGTATLTSTVTGASNFNGNVEVESSSSGGINMGSINGSDTLASGKTITIGSNGFSAGTLLLRNFTQLGSTSQSFTLSGTAILDCINATFSGTTGFTAASVLLKESTFNAAATFTSAGSTSYSMSGGNNFNAAVTFNNTYANGYIRLASTTTNTFNGNATFNGYGGGNIRPNRAIFKGNVDLNSYVDINSDAAPVEFQGSSNQNFNGNGSVYFVRNMTINKASGTVSLGTPVEVMEALTFTKGNIVTTSTNLLIIANGATATGASDSSFTSGPVKKIGNSAFAFPCGKNASYRALEMSAPSVNSNSYTAEYFDGGQTLGSTMDGTIKYIRDCGYWNFARNSGTSNVTVKLNWDSTPCGLLDSATVKVANFNGTIWKDLGNGGITGNRYTGKVANSTTVITWGYFALAYNKCFITANAGSDQAFCAGDSVTIGNSLVATMGMGTYTYSWSPSTALSSTSVANPKASPGTTTNYIVTVTDVSGCSMQDTTTVNYHARPTVSAGSDQAFCDGSNVTIGGSPTATGGASPYTYNWSPSTGLSSTTTANPTATPSATTYYYVTVTDANGCTKRDTVVITDNSITYTWTGATSTDWETSSNWSPTGVPGSCDNVIIVSSSNDPVFNSGVSYINCLTINSGTLDLYGNFLFINRKAIFNSGTLINAVLYIGGDTVAFNGTHIGNIYGCFIYASCKVVLLNGSYFDSRGDIELTQNGSGNTYSSGGNTFDSQCYFYITNSGTGNIYLATTNADIFIDYASFTSTSTGYIYPCYTKNSTFNSHLTATGHVTFGLNGGKAIIAGGGDPFSGDHSLSADTNVLFKKLEINKSSGELVLSGQLVIGDSLILTNKNIISDTTNLVIMKAGSVVSGASDNSFVSGPVMKIGSTAFVYPTGKGNYYRPIEISSPSSSTDAYTAEYFDSAQIIGDSLDTTINFISDCNYWMLKRSSGTSNVNVKLNWNSTSCPLGDSASAKVANWDGVKWKDLGNGGITGNHLIGKVVNSTTVNAYGYFTFGYIVVSAQMTISLTSTNHDAGLFGYNGSNTIRDYGWNSSDLLSNLEGNSRLFPGSLRYPAGTTANWWDWKQGWFFNESYLPNEWHLPNSYVNIDNGALLINNSLNNFKPYIFNLGARTRLDLNILSSDLPYQAASIAETHKLNIPCFEVEMGNEFYLDDDEYIYRFSDATQYVDNATNMNDAAGWSYQLKGIFGNGLKTAVVGATIHGNDPVFRRRSEWLGNIVPIVDNLNSMGGQNQIDAIVLHDYIGSAISVFPSTNSGTALTTYNKLFSQPFLHINKLMNTGEIHMITTMAHPSDIWITEFNFEDDSHPIAGTWAHALFTSSMLLKYLETPSITKMNIHNLVDDDAEFACLFNDLATSGNDWEHTALGNAIAPIAQTIKKTTSHEQLIFPGVPLIDQANNIPGVYGWLFEGPESYEAIILRLDYPTMAPPTQTVPIDIISILSLNSSASTYTLETWGQPVADYISNPADLGAQIIGNAIQGATTTDLINYAPQTFSTFNNIVNLMPYTLTRIVLSKSSPQCSAIASDIEICNGESSGLYFYGSGVGNYSVQITSQTGCTCTLSNQNSLHLDEYTATVTCSNSSTTSAGTCSISSTSPNSCSVTITVDPALPTVAITTSPNPSGTFYMPGAIALTANASGGSVDNYIWIGDHNATDIEDANVDGIPDAFGSSANINISSTETFTLYYSNNLSNQQCWALQNITIPVCNADAGPDRKICSNIGTDVATIGTAMVAGLSYSWSTGATTSQITPPHGATAVYTVTVNDGNGCSTTDDVTITSLSDCCTGPGDYLSNAESTMSDLTSSIANTTSCTACTVSGKDIYINGDLTFGDPINSVVFQNCNIYFNPDAKIISSAKTKNLTFEGCNLSRCLTGMWDGVYMSNSSDELEISKLSSTPTTVEGCENCFTTSREVEVTCTDVQFTNFNLALSLNDYDDPAATTITGNTFTGTDNLPAPLSGQTSWCGVCLDDVADADIGVGYNSGNTDPGMNTFEYSTYGIYAQHSSFHAVNNKFQHFHYPFTGGGVSARMLDVMAASGTTPGPSTAIFAISTPVINPLKWPVDKAYIGGYETDYGFNSFEDCEQAIEIAAMSSSIVRNQVWDSWRGIKSHNCWYKETIIDQDSIFDADYGVQLYENQNLSNGDKTVFGNWDTSKVTFNKFKVNSPWVCEVGTGHCTPGNGAAVRDIGDGINPEMPKINSNTIETRARYGIFVQNSKLTLIKDNTVNMMQGNWSYIPGPFFGIRSENVSSLHMGCNTISGNGTGYIHPKTAISCVNSDNLIVQNNQTSETENGMQFLGNCNLSNIRGNTMNYHRYGYYLGDDVLGAPGVIGDQSAGANNGDVPGNLFEGDPGNLGDFPSGFGLYRTHPVTLNYQASFEVANDQWPILYIPTSGANLSGNIITPILNNGDPIYDGGSTPCQSLFITGGNTISVEMLEQIANNEIESDERVTATDIASKMTLYHTLMRNPDLLGESDVLSDFADSLRESNWGLLYEVDSLIALLSDTSVQANTSLYRAYFENAFYANDAITPTDDIESNEKSVQRVYLDYLASSNFTFNGADSSDLEAIAYLCPYTQGVAVFKARALYSLINDTVFFDDSTLCASGSPRLANHVKSNAGKANNFINAQPNPASDFITFTLTPFENEMHYKIINSLGQIVKQDDICSNCSIIKLNIENLNSGAYTILIESGNHNIVLNKQFVVMKK